MIRLVLVERYGEANFTAANEEAEEFVKGNAMGFEFVTRKLFADRYRLRLATKAVLQSLAHEVKAALAQRWPFEHFHVTLEVRKDLLPWLPNRVIPVRGR